MVPIGAVSADLTTTAMVNHLQRTVGMAHHRACTKSSVSNQLDALYSTPYVEHLLICFNGKVSGKVSGTQPTSKAWTMSSASHRVPEPLRSTSSGGSGITVASEKMKGWMYVMYR